MRRSLYGLACLISILSTGCFSIAESDRAQAAIEGAQLVYFRDSRSGLCFAGRYLNFKEAVLTNVPCTEAVQQMIASQAVQAPSAIPRTDETSSNPSPSEPPRAGAAYLR